MENINLFLKNDENKFYLELRKRLSYIYNDLLLMKAFLGLFIIVFSFIYLYSLNKLKYFKNLNLYLKDQKNIFTKNPNDIIL